MHLIYKHSWQKFIVATSTSRLSIWMAWLHLFTTIILRQSVIQLHLSARMLSSGSLHADHYSLSLGMRLGFLTISPGTRSPPIFVDLRLWRHLVVVEGTLARTMADESLVRRIKIRWWRIWFDDCIVVSTINLYYFVSYKGLRMVGRARPLRKL